MGRFGERCGSGSFGGGGRLGVVEECSFLGQNAAEVLATECFLAFGVIEAAVYAEPNVGQVADGIGLAGSQAAEAGGVDGLADDVEDIVAGGEAGERVGGVERAGIELALTLGVVSMGVAEARAVFRRAFAEAAAGEAVIAGIIHDTPLGGMVFVTG